MGVRIIKEGSVGRDADVDFVRVSTRSDPDDDTVTLATIERVVDRSGTPRKRGPRQLIKTLITGKPMSLDAALGFAACYASAKNIGVVYAEPDQVEQS